MTTTTAQSTTMPVYVLTSTPGAAADAVTWESICHSKERFVYVRHEPFATVSRWSHRERKRPFAVQVWTPKRHGSDAISHHTTLAAAVSAAKRFAKLLSAEART